MYIFPVINTKVKGKLIIYQFRTHGHNLRSSHAKVGICISRSANRKEFGDKKMQKERFKNLNKTKRNISFLVFGYRQKRKGNKEIKKKEKKSRKRHVACRKGGGSFLL